VDFVHNDEHAHSALMHRSTTIDRDVRRHSSSDYPFRISRA